MELHQLRYFVAVAETGGFIRAAQRCGVTQPSLSQQIRKLEGELKAKLFDRSSRGAIPTEAGRALLPRAQRILAEVRETMAGVKEDIEAGRGALSVGAIPTIAPYLMPPVLSRFLKDHPDCELTVREDLTDRLIEAVVDHELDAAVMSAPVLKLITLGAMFENPLAGLTTLAAMFVESVAIVSATIETATTHGAPSRPTSATGSGTASPNTTTVAPVTMIPIKQNSVIVVGSPIAWPSA